MNSPGPKEWLGKDESAGAGWSRGDGSGKTAGHERYGKGLLCSKFKPLFLLPFCSGRKIIKTLEKNPSRDLKKYGQEDIGHMRRVVAYNGRASRMQIANLLNRLRIGVTMHRRVDAGKEGQSFFSASIRIGRDGVGICEVLESLQGNICGGGIL